MKITNNYLTTNTSIHRTYPSKIKTIQQPQLSFGKVIGQRDLLLDIIGINHLYILDEISDNANLDIFYRRERPETYDNRHTIINRAYIIPANTREQKLENHYFLPRKFFTGWLVPKQLRTKAPEGIEDPEKFGIVKVLKECQPELGSGDMIGFQNHKQSIYFNIMLYLIERTVEKNVIEATTGKKFDFSNIEDANNAIDLPLYTHRALYKAMSSNKRENKQNLVNVLEATADTFTKIINRMTLFEIALSRPLSKEEKESWDKIIGNSIIPPNPQSTEREKYRWARHYKKSLFPPSVFQNT